MIIRWKPTTYEKPIWPTIFMVGPSKCDHWINGQCVGHRTGIGLVLRWWKFSFGIWISKLYRQVK